MWVRPLPCQSKWFKAQVRSQVALRSYIMCTEDGRLYGRNRSHLYKVPENIQGMPDEDKVHLKVDYKVFPILTQLEMMELFNLQSCCSQILSPLHQTFPYLSPLEVAELLGGLPT